MSRRVVLALSIMSFFVLTGCGSNNSVPNAIVRQSHTTIQFPKVSDVQSLTIASGAATIEFIPNKPTATTKQVLNWLKTAEPVSVKLLKLKTKEQWISGGYTGPSILSLHLVNKQTITIIPAFYIWSDPIGGFDYRYLDGVIACENGDRKAYFKAPDLYKWLKQNHWRQEFNTLSR